MADQTDDPTDDEQTEYSEYSEYVAVGPFGWGRGPTEYAAIKNAAPNIEIGEAAETKIKVNEVPEGLSWSVGMNGALRCEKVRSAVSYHVDADHLAHVADLAKELDLQVDTMLGEGEQVKHDLDDDGDGEEQ